MHSKVHEPMRDRNIHRTHFSHVFDEYGRILYILPVWQMRLDFIAISNRNAFFTVKARETWKWINLLVYNYSGLNSIGSSTVSNHS